MDCELRGVSGKKGVGRSGVDRVSSDCAKGWDGGSGV